MFLHIISVMIILHNFRWKQQQNKSIFLKDIIEQLPSG